MRVAYQDCGCIALPDEIVAALGLGAGSVLDISYDAGTKTVSMTVADAADGDAVASSSCRIRTDTK
jgi:hypothetical protein